MLGMLWGLVDVGMDLIQVGEVNLLSLIIAQLGGISYTHSLISVDSTLFINEGLGMSC